MKKLAGIAAQHMRNDVRHPFTVILTLGLCGVSCRAPRTLSVQTTPLLEVSRSTQPAFCDSSTSETRQQWLELHPELDALVDFDSLASVATLVSSPSFQNPYRYPSDQWVGWVQFAMVIDATGAVLHEEVVASRAALIRWGSDGQRQIIQSEAESHLRRLENLAKDVLTRSRYEPARDYHGAPQAELACQVIDVGLLALQ